MTGRAGGRLGNDVLVVLVGASGAGKSTWAAATFPADGVVASDALREIVAGSADDLRASADAFDLLERIVTARAARGLPTCVDTLGTDADRRAGWVATAREHGLRPVAVLLPVSAAEARRRNEARGKAVPKAVLDRQARAVRELRDAHAWDDEEVATAGPLLDEGFALVLQARPTRLVPASLVGPTGFAAGPGSADVDHAPTSSTPEASRASGRPSTSGPPGTVAPLAERGYGPAPGPTPGLMGAPIPDEHGRAPAARSGTGPGTPAAQRVDPDRPADVFRSPDGRLRLGLHVSRFDGVPADELGERLAEVARTAEQVGVASLWLMDHVQQIPQVGRAWDPMLEAFGALGHLAAHTTTLRIGTLVAGISHRHLGWLGQQVATLDVLCGGRVTCGLGLAWYEREHHDAGVPFPSRDDRYALLEDALDGLPRLWGPGTRPWSGQVVEWAATTCYPRPLQDPVPLLVGGQGPRRTLPLAGAKADACNLFGEPDEVAAKVAIVREAAVAAGRAPDDVAVTTLGPLLVATDDDDLAGLLERHRHPSEAPTLAAERLRAGTVEDHVDRLARFAAVGVDEAIVHLPALDVGLVERLAPLLDALGSARPVRRA